MPSRLSGAECQCACRDIQAYLEAVLSKRLPVNHDIMAGLQDVLNLLPNLNVEELTRAFAVKSNDMMLVIYVASLVRSVLALHNLLNNKVRTRDRNLRHLTCSSSV